MVRAFEDEGVVHVEGSIDPKRDIETIQVELALADLATAERRREKAQKNAKGGDKTARAELEVLEKILPALEQGKSARTVVLTNDEKATARDFFLLTMKPTIYAANVDEATLADPDANAGVRAIRDIAAAGSGRVFGDLRPTRSRTCRTVAGRTRRLSQVGWRVG